MNLSNNISILLSESYIISDSNISVDLNKFESGEYKKLIISGLSGAGKTTTANLLAKKYNIRAIDTDDIRKALSDKYPDDKFSSEYRTKFFKEEFKELLLSDEKLIIAGLTISKVYRDDLTFRNLILNNAFIFMGKSALKSAIDGYNRNRKKENNPYSFYDSVKDNFTYFYDRELKMKKDRLSIPGSNISEFK